MPDPNLTFRYLAFDAKGRRVRGRLQAASETRAFEALKRDGFSPLKLSPLKPSSGSPEGVGSSNVRLRDQDIEALFSDLAALLRAGADIRGALAILSRRSDRASVKAAGQSLSEAISGGTSVERATSALVGPARSVLPALIAAGEAGGDLAGGFERGSELLAARRRIREQLVSTLSYPLFVLISTLAAMGLIFFFVIPSLEPLVADAGASPPLLLSLLLKTSQIMQKVALPAGVVILALLVLLLGLGRAGILTRPIQRLMLRGPWSVISVRLVYGGFAVTLGGMLGAGAPITDALRLAIRAVGWTEARERLQPVTLLVRQGEPLSTALERVERFPSSIARLAAVGEATGALGPMLIKAGAFDEASALKQIEAGARLLGPLLIVLLGGLIGLLMAALLSGLTSLGESALQ